MPINASAQVETLLAVNGRILVGGDYKSINGNSANPQMTGLNATTGRATGRYDGRPRLRCDSLYGTTADASTAYFGGHERWSMNSYGCSSRGPGAYDAVGMEGLSPLSGSLYLNKTNSAGYYERSRGIGADDMLLTSVGLWIASDNEGNSQTCGFVPKLSGICFLPYR